MSPNEAYGYLNLVPGTEETLISAAKLLDSEDKLVAHAAKLVFDSTLRLICQKRANQSTVVGGGTYIMEIPF